MKERTIGPGRRDVLKRGAALTGTVALGGVASAGTAAAATRRVGPNDSIQDAVDAADPGDTVVFDGTYREQVVIRKDLTLRGRRNAQIVAPSGRLRNLSRLRPVVGVAGADTEVTLGGFTVDGEDRSVGGLYTCIGYYRADGEIRDVTATRADSGAFVTQNRGGGGDQDVTVRDCRFEDLGREPLIFNEPGTTGRVTGSTFVGTPGTRQNALTAGYGASIDVRRNTFRDFYGGFSIGFYAFDSADNDVKHNTFDDVQYAAYLLANSSSDASASAGGTRFIGNDVDGSGLDLPDGATSYGTTIYAFDPDDDDTTETANNVRVVNNDYADLDVGVGTYTAGDGEVRNTKIIRNTFTRVGEPVDDNGEATKTRASRVD